MRVANNPPPTPPHNTKSVEAGTLDRVKTNPGDETEKGGFLVDSKEAGSVTGLLHVLKGGESDPAFATVKARGEATVSEKKKLLLGSPGEVGSEGCVRQGRA